MSGSGLQPLIGVPACVREIDDNPFHAVGDKYLRAVTEAAQGLPMVIPAFGENGIDLSDLVWRLDGLMLTGSPSNVYPVHYGSEPHPEAEPHDLERDATTLPLIRLALESAVPLLAICRGMQELNVALGGSLHARVHELPGRMDHRRPKHDDPDVQYGPRHEVALTPGGAFEALAGTREITVNSLHGQALDRVAEGLAVEAVAADGTIEAVSVTGAPAFALGVQWHPEYKALENPFSTRLFSAFGEAARARARERSEGASGPPGSKGPD
ncbi:MAG: gamma-glutamyl-gamma-aminobutyrate hydrolase family protein [Kiloniellales bacterium]